MPQIDGPLTIHDVLGLNGVIPALSSILDLGGKRESVRLSLFCIFPLVALGAASLHEDRFFLGSVVEQNAAYGSIVGMSFLGDTMVWPYCILIPLLIKLVYTAGKHTSRTINRLIDQVRSHDNQNCQLSIEKTIEKTKYIFTGGRGPVQKLISYMPIALALSFWCYNTATCLFHHDLGPSYYPYKSSMLTIIDATKGVHHVKADVSVSIPKWDCDRKLAPLSAWSTRAWSLVYYSLSPFLLYRLVLMIVGLIYFLRDFRLLSEFRATETASRDLLVKPFSHDGFGGLGYIADTGMAYFYSSFVLLLLVIMSLFKESANPSWHNYLLIVFLLPVVTYTFLAPSIVAMQTIRDAKMRYLILLSEMNDTAFHDIIVNHVNTSGVKESHYYHVATLRIFYEKVYAMSIWPFSVSTLLKMTLTIASPILAVAVQELIQYAVKS